MILKLKQLLIICFTVPTTYMTLLDNIKSVLRNILEQSDSFINNILLFGDTSLHDSSNNIILNATMNYITSTKRFDGSIFAF